MAVRWVDAFDGGVGWTVQGDRLRRTSHALAAAGGVWLVDPVDALGVEERVRELGEPRGVIQLLDRHNRDCEAVARRLGVPLHRQPRFAIDGAPFLFQPVLSTPLWREVALWWDERRALVVGDALGTVGFFRSGDEPIGVHPLLRLRPPRALGRYDAEHVLCGHGAGLHGADTAAAVRDALRTARRGLPRAWLGVLRWWPR